ncbi:MAG: hypothetical protein P8Y18_05935 [Candidatus Bathyarchaeota archaeon]
MKKLLIIGSYYTSEAENIEWTRQFCDFEKYDSIIIDLTSFPKNYPKTLFKNIGILKRASRLFIRDNKEIFCIMEKPFKILFKQIPLNYSWLPFPQKLTVNPMLLGKTIFTKSERFAEYFENVKKWDNELFWENTKNCSFETIAVNKSNNPIAATITINCRGKIHFLPKVTNVSSKKAIDLLIKYAKNLK